MENLKEMSLKELQEHKAGIKLALREAKARITELREKKKSISDELEARENQKPA